MHTTETRILKDSINSVAHSNKAAWEQLKREIHDYGYQHDYPAQALFEHAAKQALVLLSDFEKRKLIQLWNNSSPKREQLLNDEITEKYALMITEQVVSRARSATYRTINW